MPQTGQIVILNHASHQLFMTKTMGHATLALIFLNHY
jgi:hypothetical protein